MELEKDQNVWEIGPGLGAMSGALLDAGVRLTLFEIDPAYCSWLAESLVSGRLTIIEGNVLRTWPAQWSEAAPQRILGNLPYNMASSVIASFIESDRVAPLSVFTVQDEMGRRMKAVPETKDYSSFSVLCQTSAYLQDGGRLSPGSFYPAPRVHSRIMLLRAGTPCGEILNPQEFRLIVRSLFASRRKTLGNNLNAAVRLKGFPGKEKVAEAFAAEKIDLSRRPETVSPEEWVALANRVAQSG